MKKRLLIVTSILLLSTSIFGGCGKKEKDTQSDSTQIAEQEEKKEVGGVWDVLFDRQEDENNNKYAIITAVDEDGNEVWKYTTENAETYLIPGEIKGNFYCYEDGNTTTALNLSDGTLAWTFKREEWPDECKAIITVLDENKKEMWSYTAQTKCDNSTVISEFYPIGIYGDYFYYLENGTIVALNRLDGNLAWENHDFGDNHYVIQTAIGMDGTLYLSSYDVALFAVDKQGRTLEKIDQFDDEYLWTLEMVCYDDYVEVTCSTIGLAPEGTIVYRVNLSDYSYEVSKPDERVSNKKFTTYGVGPAVDVQFEFVYTQEDSGEYAKIIGVDKDGETIWEYITEKYSVSKISNIGIHGDYYYYGENGIIVARNVSDGTVVWENIDGITEGCSVFDNDGTLYLCGGGDGRSSFMAIDKNGNTLVYIDEIHSLDYGNPWKMEYMGDYIEVTMDYYGNDPDGKSGVFRINLNDYSCELVR